MKNSIKTLIIGVGLLFAGNALGQFTQNGNDLYHNNGNVGIGPDTSPNEDLHINGTGSVNLLLEADTDNSNEADHPQLQFSQDGGIVTGYVGYGNSSNNLRLVNNNGDLNLVTQSSTRMMVDYHGNIGIGTTNPLEKLQIGDRFVFHDGGSKYLGFNMEWSNSADRYMVSGQGASRISFLTDGGIRFDHGASGTAGNPITHVSSLLLANNGQVSIGDTDFSGCTDCSTSDFLLFVRKGIRTEQVKIDVATTNDWADYVFADDYKLQSLNEVETFIEKNNHLPNVPSAEEVVKNGVNLGEMDATLLRKIEELTLYTIEQQKLIEEQQKAIDLLMKTLESK